MLASLLTLWWRLLETTSVHWVSEPERQHRLHTSMCSCKYVRVEPQSCTDSSAKLAVFVIFRVQVSLWKVHLRPKLNVTIRAMDPVTCATGPQRLESMLCMYSATTKTSSTLPSWLRLSAHQAKTSTLTRYAHTQGHVHLYRAKKLFVLMFTSFIS